MGNYLGAVKGWVTGLEVGNKEWELEKFTPRKSIYNVFLIKVAEEKRDSQIFCVVDMHAITLPQNPQVLRSAPSLS